MATNTRTETRFPPSVEARRYFGGLRRRRICGKSANICVPSLTGELTKCGWFNHDHKHPRLKGSGTGSIPADDEPLLSP